MPHNPSALNQWTRHEVEYGTCTRCAQQVPTLHKGPIWIYQTGLRSTVEPMGQWKECTD